MIISHDLVLSLCCIELTHHQPLCCLQDVSQNLDLKYGYGTTINALEPSMMTMTGAWAASYVDTLVPGSSGSIFILRNLKLSVTSSGVCCLPASGCRPWHSRRLWSRRCTRSFPRSSRHRLYSTVQLQYVTWHNITTGDSAHNKD